MSDLADVWDELVADTHAPEGTLAKRISSRGNCGVLLAVDKPSGRRSVFVEVDSAAIADQTALPDAGGYRIEVQHLSSKPSRSRLILYPTGDAFADLFEAVVSDVLGYLEGDQSQAINALLGRLDQWQRFFEKGGVEGLSEGAQQGLYAELWFLRAHVLRHLPAKQALAAWSGPFAANHDFQLPTLSVEVKSSTANPSLRINITNVRQLDPVGARPLYLNVVQLDVSVNAVESLPEIVDTIRAGIRESAPQAVSTFNRVLLEIGYIESHRERYGARKYSVRNEIAFHVTDGFPRIVESDLRTGVGGVRYTIDLSACEQFKCVASRIDELLRAEHAD